MQKESLCDTAVRTDTRIRILETALELSAKKGFSDVSLRDIAEIVGVKMASIYYYYQSKDDMLDDIFSNFSTIYEQHLTWVLNESKKAKSIEEVIDNMFNDDFLKMIDSKKCLGLALIKKEQHKNETARSLIVDLFYNYSIDFIKTGFDKLAEKGMIPKADTRLAASMFILGVLAINDIRVHEYMGAKLEISSVEYFNMLKRVLLTILRQEAQQDSSIRKKKN